MVIADVHGGMPSLVRRLVARLREIKASFVTVRVRRALDDRCHVESCPRQRRGEAMLALQSGAPGTGHIEAVIVVIAICTVIFWRDVVKILFMVALLLFIILIASGAVAVIDVLQHVVK